MSAEARSQLPTLGFPYCFCWYFVLLGFCETQARPFCLVLFFARLHELKCWFINLRSNYPKTGCAEMLQQNSPQCHFICFSQYSCIIFCSHNVIFDTGLYHCQWHQQGWKKLNILCLRKKSHPPLIKNWHTGNWNEEEADVVGGGNGTGRKNSKNHKHVNS